MTSDKRHSVVAAALEESEPALRIPLLLWPLQFCEFISTLACYWGFLKWFSSRRSALANVCYCRGVGSPSANTTYPTRKRREQAVYLNWVRWNNRIASIHSPHRDFQSCFGSANSPARNRNVNNYCELSLCRCHFSSRSGLGCWSIDEKYCCLDTEFCEIYTKVWLPSVWYYIFNKFFLRPS